jgi:hypothetical protein
MDADAREFQEQRIMEERNTATEFKTLKDEVDAYLVRNSRARQPSLVPRFPTAAEIASEVSKQMKDSQSPPNSFHQAPPVPPVASVVPAPVVPLDLQPAVVQPCRRDHLDMCSDAQLLEWGKPLMANLDEAENEYMADLKKLDDIKSGNWLSGLIGTSDNKWLKAYASAQEQAADKFRECCAEDAIIYHKELSQRTGGGPAETTVYEWVRNLLEPIQSKEWKRAAQDAGKGVNVVADLHSLEFTLQIAATKKR